MLLNGGSIWARQEKVTLGKQRSSHTFASTVFLSIALATGLYYTTFILTLRNVRELTPSPSDQS